MVEINEIEFIEEPEYFKLQHGSCFCMLEEEKKRNENFSSEETKLANSNFTISNAKQKGLYFFNKNLNVFSLSDFLYKIDNENSKDSSDKINIKSQPFEENVLLIENNKTDTQAFFYTDHQNIYVFDYGSEKVNLHCRVDVPIRGLKYIDDHLLLLLSSDERVHLMKNKQMYECQEWTDHVNNIDEKNGVFLFTYSNKEVFILKDCQKSNTYDLSNISKEIDICHDKCNIMCAKILEAQKNMITIFLMVLYKYEEELTTIMYDLQIEQDKIKKVTYSTNDFDFQNFENNFVKCIYISEWQTIVAISSESCEAVVYTRNGNITYDRSLAQPLGAGPNVAEWDRSSGLKFLSVMEGYKINTRDSETFFLSLFMYTKYEDKIYRKSKIGNVPFLKNPCVFFALQDNHKIVVEYLDKYKLVDNTEFSTNAVEDGDANECGMKEVTVLPDLKENVVEVHEPISSNVFNIFKVKERVAQNKIDSTKGNEPIGENKKESFFDLFRSKVKFTDEKGIDDNVQSTDMGVRPPGKEATCVPGEQSGVNIEMDKIGEASPVNNDHDSHAKNRKNQLAKEQQHLYRCIRRSAKVYEDESFIVNEVPDAFNKLIKSGIYFCEEFLNHMNVHSIEKRKNPKVGSRKKECYYDKGLDKIVFLHDSVIGEDVDEVREDDDEEGKKKKKKIPKRNNKSEFHHHFHCEDFDFYKHKKLSDRQCERIIKKIERKQGFLCDIKGIFLTEQEAPHDKVQPKDKYEKKTLPLPMEEPREDPFNGDIQVHISDEERSKFYEQLDSYFSKRKVLKVRKEIFNDLKNGQLAKGHIFETVLYNIYKQGGMKHCEALIYFLLKNMEVKIFSNSFFLLELYFAHLLSPYLKENRTNALLPSYGKKSAPSIKIPSLKSLLGSPFSGGNRSSAHPIYDEKELPLDSEYSQDEISEDDILKKIKNEKDFAKKNEYLAKVIPLFNESTNKENESTSFHLMNAGIQFANKRMCNALSHKLFPILVDSGLNKMDDELGLIKNYLFDVVLTNS
ncbi:conserved Plasmodium protein, unknown function [Plasmodium knowlesi strain H]|uniref:Uncharacterized protein n=3 Tax=Plasmodium knowlesi TaxID=5850 RepID=A0A5K1UX18_PLAKH|nr:conserved Plasmodium protein, unknown function [Plasmodium knowlesi strain H]OTN64716.1 Uncharacterized protein PKNOH_S130197700 [Plasmodium knowlesi]CAA9989137.1 conserved Plasmodium protein, unknown function [Plasmodium knowlesi strain H]SBO27355.1 conserved Plasmodium protein, unknown function [Plasmodium knowlesi strain H]SBO27531.1 conserved Plasmodium protein, unknown function [Plasmodium knowlesi strain H]VVS78611.1 conserved Plasmodium protein, unknown function [Plasmodium knowlesi |eukprot:XP_002261484.1 hypothetical protein, conserved in Plasmodium species [Plasmodium knowlesi strain H]